MGMIRHFRELEVYQLAMVAVMTPFELSKGFPLVVNMITHPEQWSIR
jgi:hypothetical protein